MSLESLRKRMRSSFEVSTTDNNFLDELRRKYEQEKVVIDAPTNEEMYASQVDSNMDLLASFFGLGSADEAKFVFEEATAGMNNSTVETIMSTTEHLNQNRVQEEETVRTMTLEEANAKYGNEKGDVFDVPRVQFIEHPNDDVVSDSSRSSYSAAERSKQWSYYNDINTNTSSSTNRTTSSNVNKTSLRSGNPSQSNTSSSASTNRNTTNTRTNDAHEPIKLIKHLDEMNSSVQRLAAQRNTNWSKPASEEDEIVSRSMRRARWYKKAIYHTKRFFKTGKGRITIKMGIAMALQLAMGIVGKRYEFENAGQMGLMFSMMLASFFITRELAEDGIDASGIGF